MATRLRYRLNFADASSFMFDADGTFEWGDLTRTYDEDTNYLTEVRRSWTIRGTILAAQNLEAAGWASFVAFQDALDQRGAAQLESVDLLLVDDTGGTETILSTVRTLGPPEWDQLRCEQANGLPDPDNPGTSYLKSHTVELVITARRLIAAGADEEGGLPEGVLSLEQTIEHAYDAGLETVTWVTLLTTDEGVDAVALGKELGVVPIDSYGSSYSYKTNGPEGVAWEELDANTALDPDRTVTKVRVTSQIKEWGITVGPVSPGEDPDDYTYLERTEETEDETVYTLRVGASGPGARSWVESKKPAGDLETDEVEHDSATRQSAGSWVIRTKKGAVALAVIVVDVTGGHQSFTLEPVPGGYPPSRQDGPVQPWKATVSLTLTRLGGTGERKDLPLPPLLPEPWALDWDASSEGAPYQEEPKAVASKARWRRDVRLVFLSATRPTRHPADHYLQAQGASVESYYFD